MNPKSPDLKLKVDNHKIKTFSYALAWINFVGIIGIAIYDAIKGKEPPRREDFYRQ